MCFVAEVLCVFQREAPSLSAFPQSRSGRPARPHPSLPVQASVRDVSQYGDHRRDAVQPLRDRHLRQGQARGPRHDAQVRINPPHTPWQ